MLYVALISTPFYFKRNFRTAAPYCACLYLFCVISARDFVENISHVRKYILIVLDCGHFALDCVCIHLRSTDQIPLDLGCSFALNCTEQNGAKISANKCNWLQQTIITLKTYVSSVVQKTSAKLLQTRTKNELCLPSFVLVCASFALWVQLRANFNINYCFRTGSNQWKYDWIWILQLCALMRFLMCSAGLCCTLLRFVVLCCTNATIWVQSKFST